MRRRRLALLLLIPALGIGAAVFWRVWTPVVIENKGGASVTLEVASREPGFVWSGELAPGDRTIRVARRETLKRGLRVRCQDFSGEVIHASGRAGATNVSVAVVTCQRVTVAAA